uniref:peptidyl-tRNA hydrolase n=2 Tax=Lutzomyia longipalpis TaxID=7200 RepID=A0A1B0CL04_LUTLO
MLISRIFQSKFSWKMSENLVQYIIVRKDILKERGLYFIMAESCLACSSIHLNSHEDPATQKYFSDIDNMHKVVLGVDNETQLEKLVKDLQSKDIVFELRRSEENIPTCLAVKVYEKSQIAPLVKKLKLLR